MKIGSIENRFSANPEFKLEYTGNGFVFKDEIAFNYFHDLVCYVAELEDDEDSLPSEKTGSSYSDFLEICEGNHELAQELFGEVDWQHPSTLYNDWDLHGKFDEDETTQVNEARSAANYVSSFFYYMWNSWCEDECKTVFGGQHNHFWTKWCGIVTKNGTGGAAERFYAELSENYREMLVNQACEIYDRSKRIK